MTKRIVIIEHDSSVRYLDTRPTLAEMQAIVGGDIEQVLVLDRIEDGHPIYTSMYVNEEGLINDLPRNARATEIYQRNARFQHPDAANPFVAMQQAMIEACARMNVTVIHQRPQAYRDDPYICGPAIYFQGWTCEDVDAAYGV
jgi:Domain of unknown function (DUF3846)